MKEPTGGDKQGKTKSKRGGNKQDRPNRECDNRSPASSRIKDTEGTGDEDTGGTEAATASPSDEEATKKKARGQVS